MRGLLCGRNQKTQVALGAFVGLLLVIPVALAAPSPAAVEVGRVALQLDGNGTLFITLSVTVQNGSALRFAMDGNFTPIVSSLPISDSEKASLLSTIAQLQTSPITSGLFGDRDGTVTDVEVRLFESLLLNGAEYLPGGGIVGAGSIGILIDGANATSSRLAGVTFENATGPDTSPAPIQVETGIISQFALAGASHTLALSLGPSLPPSLPSLGLDAGLSFVSPAATTITGTAGLASVSTTNDVWGWGTGSTSGAFELQNSSAVRIDFSNSFPTGYVLIGGLVGAALVATVVVLLLRRRPKPTPALAPTPGRTDGVEPSGSG